MTDKARLRHHRIHEFRPKVLIHSEKGSFLLKTVTESWELIEALQLRYQVLYHEMIGRKKATGIDVDSFDLTCDHLIILDKESNRVVGTYRLNCSLNSDAFYSAQEFDLTQILKQPGVKIELGRACIHKDFRKGAVINLLWRGIMEYMNKTNADLLFGCATIKTGCPRQAALLHRLFETENRYKKNYVSTPTEKFTAPEVQKWLKDFDRELTPEEIQEASDLVPSLFKSYLKAGASLGGLPAYDAEFDCYDFLTILPKENLGQNLIQRFSGRQNPPAEAVPHFDHTNIPIIHL